MFRGFAVLIVLPLFFLLPSPLAVLLLLLLFALGCRGPKIGEARSRRGCPGWPGLAWGCRRSSRLNSPLLGKTPKYQNPAY